MKNQTAKTSGWKYRGMSVGILAAVLAALLALSIAATALENRYGWRQDYSYNSITTHSEATRAVLESLSKPAHIYAFFARNQEDKPLTELLNRYAAATPMVTWELTDPALNPTLVTKFSDAAGSVEYDTLVVYCEETGRKRILNGKDFLAWETDTETGEYKLSGYAYERAVTGALKYVTQDRVPRVVIAQGHGTISENALSAFSSLLTENHYDVVFQKLSGELNPDDLLIFFNPKTDLLDSELKRVTDFAAAGGSLLFTCDYDAPITSMPNYASLLRSYGFIPKDGVVTADKNDTGSYAEPYQTYVIPEMQVADVTYDLIAFDSYTVLTPASRAFEAPEDTDRNLTAEVLLQSGATSYLKKPNALTQMKEAGDEEGPFALALQAKRVTEDGYITRAAVFGSSATLTEEQLYTMTDSQQLIIRLMEYLLDMNASDLNIMARSMLRPELSVESNRFGSVLITALPLAVLFAALAVLIRRKNR